jgi:hypothetical protein
LSWMWMSVLLPSGSDLQPVISTYRVSAHKLYSVYLP